MTDQELIDKITSLELRVKRIEKVLQIIDTQCFHCGRFH